MVLVDGMNVLFIEFHISRKKLRDEGKELDEENFSFFLHNYFNKINSIVANSGKLIMCWEGKKSIYIRRGIYPDYKKNRDINKTDDAIQILMNNLPRIQDALKYYPIKQMWHEDAEADDVIYALSMAYKDEPTTIISTDKDLSQILNYRDNIIIWNPIKKYKMDINEHILAEKAICGDASDNIKGLYRVGPKTFNKMLEDKNKWNEIMNRDNNKDLYNALLKIIDLRKFPKNIHEEIVDKEKNIEYNEFNPDEIEQFYWDNRLPDLIMRWSNIKEEIRSVIK